MVHLMNHPEDRHLVNGTRGVVTGFEKGTRNPQVQLASGRTRTIKKHMWELKPNPRGKVLASRTQIPLKLAWALSIHKSQGMSIDRLESLPGSLF